jgi:type II secretory pathway component PulK
MKPTARGKPRGRKPRRAELRRGVAALIALVCLSLATIVGTLLLQAALGEQRYLNRLELKSQGEWLVEAGFSRAAAQLARSARYSGETWTISGSAFGRTQDATVRIVVDRNSANVSRRHVDVQATFSQSNEPAIEASRDFPIR